MLSECREGERPNEADQKRDPSDRFGPCDAARWSDAVFRARAKDGRTWRSAGRRRQLFHVEIVPKGALLEVYLRDHSDKAVSTEGFRGAAILVIDGKPERITLTPAGGNQLKGASSSTFPLSLKAPCRSRARPAAPCGRSSTENEPLLKGDYHASETETYDSCNHHRAVERCTCAESTRASGTPSGRRPNADAAGATVPACAKPAVRAGLAPDHRSAAFPGLTTECRLHRAR